MSKPRRTLSYEPPHHGVSEDEKPLCYFDLLKLVAGLAFCGLVIWIWWYFGLGPG